MNIRTKNRLSEHTQLGHILMNTEKRVHHIQDHILCICSCGWSGWLNL